MQGRSGEDWGNCFDGRGKNPRFGKFIQGRGAGNYIVWVGDVGPFGVNVEEGRGETHRVPATDHREESKAITRRDMGDVGDGRRTRGSGNPVDEDLHRATAVNRGAVGGATSLI